MYILLQCCAHSFYHHCSSTNQVADMEASIQGLEGERDFYFGKLREIEVVCQQNEGLPFVQDILDIMYATQVSGCVSLVH